MTVVVVQSILKQTLAEQVLRLELILVFVCNREGIQRDTKIQEVWSRYSTRFHDDVQKGKYLRNKHFVLVLLSDQKSEISRDDKSLWWLIKSDLA